MGNRSIVKLFIHSKMTGETHTNEKRVRFLVIMQIR